MSLVKIGNETYQDGDTPQDQVRQHVTRNALIAVTLSVVTVAGLGTVGIPLVSVFGLGTIGLQALGLLTIAWDHVESSDDWEAQDKLIEHVTDNNPIFSTRVTAQIAPIETKIDLVPVIVQPAVVEQVAIVDLVPVIVQPAVVEQVAIVEQIAVKPSYSSVSSKVKTTKIVEVIPEPILDINVAEILAREKYSYAIMSPSGGGKGMLVANALRLIKQMNPNIHLFLVDPKDDEKERGYWDGIVDTWHRCDFNSLRKDKKSAFIEEAIEEYMSITGPKILIFDEATNVFGYLKNCDKPLLAELKSFLSGIASSGNSRKNYVWLVGHSGNLGDYGISGGEMSCFRKFYIAPISNIEAIEQLGNTTFAGGQFGDDTVDYIKVLAAKSPVARAVYVGTSSRWESMGELENYSGYNRDTETFTDVKIEPVYENVSDVQLLFDRALMDATRNKDFETFMELQKIKSVLHEPGTARKLEKICMSVV